VGDRRRVSVRERSHVRGGGLLLAFLVVLAPACKRHADEAAGEAPASAAASEAKPVDHLAPGELAEGTERAFGLTLPRGVHVDAEFSDQAWAHGDVAYGPLVDYVRTRVRGGSLMKRDDGAYFQKVTLPDNPKRTLSIRVQPHGAGGASIALADETPSEVPPSTTPEEELRQVGLTKDGKLLDPKNLH
jgi:hypothetical protein